MEHENLYRRALAVFSAAVRGEHDPSASGEDRLRSLATALALRESAGTGQRVTIAY